MGGLDYNFEGRGPASSSGAAPRTPTLRPPPTATSTLSMGGAEHSPLLRGRTPSTAGGPPRTSSTTLSTLWRRALSTPALHDGAATGDAAKKRATEDWYCSAGGDIPKDELVRLVEHVHGRLLQERQRRRELEADLSKRGGTSQHRRRSTPALGAQPAC